jgi:hypothetical protein
MGQFGNAEGSAFKKEIAGEEGQLVAYFNITPNCAPAEPRIVVVEKPLHGSVRLLTQTLVSASDINFYRFVSAWSKDDPRAKCVLRVISVKVVSYVPDRGYAGADRVVVDILDKNFAKREKIEIYVSK